MSVKKNTHIHKPVKYEADMKDTRMYYCPYVCAGCMLGNMCRTIQSIYEECWKNVHVDQHKKAADFNSMFILTKAL